MYRVVVTNDLSFVDSLFTYFFLLSGFPRQPILKRMSKQYVFTCMLLFLLTAVTAQQEEPPPYCNEFPTTYGGVTAPNSPGGSTKASPLPRFATTPIKEYKVQVAILRQSDPSSFPFHPLLVARYRPCEQVWVIESRNSYASRAEAENLKKRLIDLGYQGAYLTELIAYQ